MKTLIFGHKNPDSDSIASTLALSHLKNGLGEDTIPCMLGPINKETKYILDTFGVAPPQYIENVKTQIRDLNYDRVPGLLPHHSILHGYRIMERNNIRTLPIVDGDNKLLGIVTMKDIAMSLIKGDQYHVETSLENITRDLEGEILNAPRAGVCGRVMVIAYFSQTVIKLDHIHEDSIIIVGDRYAVIDHAIHRGVQLIIFTGDAHIPSQYINKARERGVSLIRTQKDTYTTSRLINQCNYISTIMVSQDIVKFNEDEYLDEVNEEIISKNHSNYPIIDSSNQYIGMMNKQHLLSPDKKRVILVDHNEYSQSAEGLEEAEILEIVDHHKIGDISTSMPILFRNMPVGSTCTIVYNLYKELGVEVEEKMAGLLMGGILSDTLSLKSPTSTPLDGRAVDELNEILRLDIQNFAMNMFRAGTSLEGQGAEEIFFEDYKVFKVENKTCGLSQVFTLDIQEVFDRKDEFLSQIKEIHRNKNHFLTLLIITDIMKEGSYILYQCDLNHFISTAFQVPARQGVFVKNLVSRKKQALPKIIETIHLLK